MKVLENGTILRDTSATTKINIQRRGSAEICLRNAPREKEGEEEGEREREREETTDLVFRMRFPPSISVLLSMRILKSEIQVL